MLSIIKELRNLLEDLNNNHLSYKQVIDKLFLIESEVDTNLIRDTFISSDDVKTLIENRLAASGWENVYFTLKGINFIDDYFFANGYGCLSNVSFNDVKYCILDMIEELELRVDE